MTTRVLTVVFVVVAFIVLSLFELWVYSGDKEDEHDNMSVLPEQQDIKPRPKHPGWHTYVMPGPAYFRKPLD